VRPALKTPEFLSSGLPSLDRIIQGFPRGAISEIAGPESSGRATLVHSLLASAMAKLEVCAYVDAADAFDPQSAAAAGVLLPQLVWIRCGHDAEHALKSADLLLHAGGFGVVVLDLCRVGRRKHSYHPGAVGKRSTSEILCRAHSGAYPQERCVVRRAWISFVAGSRNRSRLP
jgi:RecA/RadA recombinase